MTGWSDRAYQQNQRDISGYRSAWNTPDGESTPFRAPGNDGAFRDARVGVDDPKKSFTTRKRHGWWGPEVRVDAQGREF